MSPPLCIREGIKGWDTQVLRDSGTKELIIEKNRVIQRKTILLNRRIKDGYSS
jgi:hypothetical protein